MSTVKIFCYIMQILGHSFCFVFFLILITIILTLHSNPRQHQTHNTLFILLCCDNAFPIIQYWTAEYSNLDP